MKIAMIGATGAWIGASLLGEALARGHNVIAICRNVDKLPEHALITPTKVDIFQPGELEKAVSGCDAVIHCFATPVTDTATLEERVDFQRRATQIILAATKDAKVPRLLAVGGAGTLHVASGEMLMDTPDLPEEWYTAAKATAEVKNVLEKEKDLSWTVLCPSLYILHEGAEAAATGTYRLGLDDVLYDNKGVSSISIGDFVAAFIDELERPQHEYRRFTVGY